MSGVPAPHIEGLEMEPSWEHAGRQSHAVASPRGVVAPGKVWRGGKVGWERPVRDDGSERAEQSTMGRAAEPDATGWAGRHMRVMESKRVQSSLSSSEKIQS